MKITEKENLLGVVVITTFFTMFSEAWVVIPILWEGMLSPLVKECGTWGGGGCQPVTILNIALGIALMVVSFIPTAMVSAVFLAVPLMAFYETLLSNGGGDSSKIRCVLVMILSLMDITGTIHFFFEGWFRVANHLINKGPIGGGLLFIFANITVFIFVCFATDLFLRFLKRLAR